MNDCCDDECLVDTAIVDNYGREVVTQKTTGWVALYYEPKEPEPLWPVDTTT